MLIGSRKVRKNHNEFERRRRDQQRQRLEELRQAIPGLDAKASMVAVLTAARQYIDELKMKSGGGGGVPSISVSRADSFGNQLQDLISPPRSPLGTGNGRNSEEFDMGGLLGVAGGYRKSSSESDDAGAIRKGRTAVLDTIPPIYNLPSHPNNLMSPPVYFPNQARPSLLLSVMDESLVMGQHRKDSALLLPTPDPATFVYGQRDSMHAMFSVPLPHIIEPNHPSYVACGKCGRGVESLIMIDCDVCHRWYHIRCMGINPSSIPVRWACAECPQHHQ